MHISYRTRHALKVLAIVLLVLAAVGLVVYIGWFRWIERYVVYTRDGGAVLNRELDPVIQRGNPAVPPEKKTVTVIYKDAEEEGQSDANQELTQMIGYYADAEMLADMDLVRQQIELLEPGTPVMLDVKDGKGRFYYDSGSFCRHRPAGYGCSDPGAGQPGDVPHCPFARFPGLCLWSACHQ